MRMRAEQLRPFDADRSIAQGGAFGGTGDDADVKGHRQAFAASAPSVNAGRRENHASAATELDTLSIS